MKASVIVFVDAHVVVSSDWLAPLYASLQKYPSASEFLFVGCHRMKV